MPPTRPMSFSRAMKAVRRTSSNRQPRNTKRIDRSSSVRRLPTTVGPRPPRSEPTPEVKERIIIGSVRHMLMMPAAATQPAPINRVYPA